MDAIQIQETVLSILKSRMHKMSRSKVFPSNDNIIKIIKSAKQIFKKESSLLHLYGNFVIIGDIHGNIDDLLRIFERFDYPPKTNYLFLGDYVDRGSNSPEVILLLLCLKILYPTSLYMIRGNHECETITSVYGFKNDCDKIFNNKVYQKFMKCFMYLSYAAVVNDYYFCVHGGIGPYLNSLDDIEKLPKPMLSSDSQIASDLVWSDPNESSKGFQPSFRGSGYTFNDKKLNNFLTQNNLKKMIRSHESCYDGFEYPLENCITVFSNTDYCEMANDAAVIVIQQFTDESSPSEDSDSEEKCKNMVEISNESLCYTNSTCSIKIETFSPLTQCELDKRRILIPECFIAEPTEKQDITESLANELFGVLDDQPICVF